MISVGIKTYIRCKEQFQNNQWDGIADNRSANSHLKTIKAKCSQIFHEGTPLDEFVSNFMKELHYSWNPPIRPTLTAVGIYDIKCLWLHRTLALASLSWMDVVVLAPMQSHLDLGFQVVFVAPFADVPWGLAPDHDLSWVC